MHIAGIVAEYNPFHTGHAYQIAQTRRALGEDCAVVAAMSGNWVQQAHCAVADKWNRARLALLGGTDLVLELPTVWATASAESFARGAVSLLHGTGVVDTLSFGSEEGEVEPLKAAAACLDNPACQARVGALAGEGLPFAVARQRAAEEFLGRKGNILANPNNNLGVEYIRALRNLDSGIAPMTVRREGAGHNVMVSEEEGPEGRPRFLSATQLRAYLAQGNWPGAEPFLVPGTSALLEERGGLPSLRRVERALLARIRTMGAEDWGRLPDAGREEGLPQRLERAGRRCTSMEEFFDLAKTKRYTHARLRRLALWAYLGITAQDIPDRPPYLRVLALNRRGRDVLRTMKERSTLPILTKPAHVRTLTEEGRKLFALECQCTDLYDLCFEVVRRPGREWTTGPVVLDR